MKNSILALLVLISCSSSWAKEFTAEEICTSLNPDSNTIAKAGLVVGGGFLALSAKDLMKAVPELYKELNTRKNLSIDKVVSAETKFEMMNAFYARELEITDKILALPNLPTTGMDMQSGIGEYLKTFESLEEKVMGSSSLNSLFKTHLHDHSASGFLHDYHSLRGEVVYGYYDDRSTPFRDALAQQRVRLANLMKEVAIVEENAGIRKLFHEKWNSNDPKRHQVDVLSEDSKKMANWLDKNESTLDKSGLAQKNDALKHSIEQDILNNREFMPEIDPSLKGTELKSRLQARESIAKEVARELFKLDYTAMQKPQEYQGLMKIVGYHLGSNRAEIFKRTAEFSFETNEYKGSFDRGKFYGEQLDGLRKRISKSGGIAAMSAALLIAAWDHDDANVISDSLRMNLSKLDDEEFADLKKGKAACLKALKDQNKLMAVQDLMKGKSSSVSDGNVKPVRVGEGTAKSKPVAVKVAK